MLRHSSQLSATGGGGVAKSGPTVQPEDTKAIARMTLTARPRADRRGVSQFTRLFRTVADLLANEEPRPPEWEPKKLESG